MLSLIKEGTVELIYKDGSTPETQKQRYVRLTRGNAEAPPGGQEDEEMMVDGLVDEGNYEFQELGYHAYSRSQIYALRNTL